MLVPWLNRTRQPAGTARPLRRVCLVGGYFQPFADVAQGQHRLACEYDSGVDVQESGDHIRVGQLWKAALVFRTIQVLVRQPERRQRLVAGSMNARGSSDANTRATADGIPASFSACAAQALPVCT